MSTSDEQSARIAEVLRLSFAEGLSVRAISRRTHMARRTVRRILGRATAARARHRHRRCCSRDRRCSTPTTP